jgi:hypothetical protein
MSMGSSYSHLASVAHKLHRGDKPLDLSTARRCVAACADYLWHDDESPQASEDLRESVKVIEQEAYNRGRSEAVAERLVGK